MGRNQENESRGIDERRLDELGVGTGSTSDATV
jgi:hypothetical protein